MGWLCSGERIREGGSNVGGKKGREGGEEV